MVPEIITGLGVLNSTLDMAKGLKNISDATIRNAAIIELQEKIVAAYSAHAALIQHVTSLEEKMTHMETWNAEKQRYSLTDYGGGTFAYMLKPEESRGEPPHRICTKCYGDGKKSILQGYGSSNAQDHCICPECKQRYSFGVHQQRDLPRTYKSDWMS